MRLQDTNNLSFCLSWNDAFRYVVLVPLVKRRMGALEFLWWWYHLDLQRYEAHSPYFLSNDINRGWNAYNSSSVRFIGDLANGGLKGNNTSWEGKQRWKTWIHGKHSIIFTISFLLIMNLYLVDLDMVLGYSLYGWWPKQKLVLPVQWCDWGA